MGLTGQQQQFTVMVANLVNYASLHGYGLRYGDAWRSTDKLQCPDCKVPHSYQDLLIYNHRSADPASKHLLRLAVDFIVERLDGSAMDSAYWDTLGSFWESQSGQWGGRWHSKDFGHFELEPT